MSFRDIIANIGLPLADKLTESLQPYVMHESWPGQNEDGSPKSTPKVVRRKAIVEFAEASVLGPNGEQVTSRATVMFPRSVRVTTKDTITLPDGSSGPILHIGGGVVDPKTGIGFATTVYLG